MSYALWHRDSMNLQGSWPTESAALAGVRKILANRARDLGGYALVRIDRRGDYHDIAEGRALLTLAQASEAKPTRRRRAA